MAHRMASMSTGTWLRSVLPVDTDREPLPSPTDGQGKQDLTCGNGESTSEMDLPQIGTMGKVCSPVELPVEPPVEPPPVATVSDGGRRLIRTRDGEYADAGYLWLIDPDHPGEDTTALVLLVARGWSPEDLWDYMYPETPLAPVPLPEPLERTPDALASAWWADHPDGTQTACMKALVRAGIPRTSAYRAARKGKP